MTGQTAGDGTDVIGSGDHGQFIRAKWMMDGAATLAEAAAKLRMFADEWDRMHAAGWKLATPVEDDYGLLIPPSAS